METAVEVVWLGVRDVLAPGVAIAVRGAAFAVIWMPGGVGAGARCRVPRGWRWARLGAVVGEWVVLGKELAVR